MLTMIAVAGVVGSSVALIVLINTVAYTNESHVYYS